LQKAATDQLVAINPDALWEFGQALHTVMDSTSPAHNDENNDPAPYIFDVIQGGAFMRAHNLKEASISQEQIEHTVSLMRMAFAMTFGDAAASKATGIKPPKTCVEVFDSATGTRSKECEK
jgi:rhamnose utilization protein RhaD (predicted bifunctional aldolase and dehydrogenase)